MDVHRALAQRRRAREVEQFADEAVDAAGLLGDDERVLAGRALRLAGEQLRRPLEPRERVLDLVGEAGRERLEVEVALAVPARPDDEHGSHAGGPVEERGGLHLQRKGRVPWSGEIGARRFLVAPDALGERLQRGAAGKRADGEPRRPIAAAVEELLGRRVEVDEPTVRPHEEDRIADGVDRTARQGRRER